jgi:hypothetical protein
MAGIPGNCTGKYNDKEAYSTFHYAKCVNYVTFSKNAVTTVRMILQNFDNGKLYSCYPIQR